jgi:hypothetical protein
MKSLLHSLNILIVIIVLLTACNKDDDGRLTLQEAIPILQQCAEDTYTDEAKITSNLIGNWTLIAYGCGFCAPVENEPIINLSFAPTTGTAIVDGETINFSWKIEKTTNIFNEPVFGLSTTPAHYALAMNYFCDDYMYFDHRPVDGLMLLYKKD